MGDIRLNSLVPPKIITGCDRCHSEEVAGRPTKSDFQDSGGVHRTPESGESAYLAGRSSAAILAVSGKSRLPRPTGCRSPLEDSVPIST